ncbi:MAG TPA: methyltransferase domain-containing protein [Vicinamibacterales bacterium]|nr:methyltransferase domain-containing protein [Vicinamibacterales bacterium]
MRRHFPTDRSARILDLGCGNGAIIQAARRYGYHNVTGVDRSSEQVADAERLGIDGVRQGGIQEAIAAADAESLDAVITFDVIEHLSREELVPLVDAIHRALRPGGCWLVHVPNAESPFFGRIRYGDITHEQAFTQSSLGQLVRSSGFRRLDCYEDTPIVHGARSALRFAVWKVVRGMLRVYLAAETGLADGSVILSQNLLAKAIK